MNLISSLRTFPRQGGTRVLKRTTCVALGHNWTRHRYPAAPDDDQPQGMYRKCVRCGHIDEGEGLPPGPMVVGF